jgi:predicted phage gp36 major capsid-like protein
MRERLAVLAPRQAGQITGAEVTGASATAAGVTVTGRLRAAVRRLAATGPGSDATAVDVRSASEVLAPLARR